MSRVLVAGPYPTMPGPEAAATFALVRELVDAGEDVTVVSPAPSAAHHHLDLGGARGAVRLARLAAGVDRLVLRLDAQALAASADPPRTLAGRFGLALALRRPARVEVHLDRVPGTVSRRWVSMVLAPAGRVVVATEEERAALVAAGAEPAKVVVEPPPGPRQAPPAREVRARPSAGPAPASAGELEGLVRRLAAEQRMFSPAGGGPAAGRASLPLRHLPRMERAPMKSNKPGGALIKRSLAKALAWQFDWVIEHVNQLHQATIDALDELERRQPPPPARPAEDETTS